MNILIIENEVYLAQKVVSRLLDDGHNCDFVENVNLENLTKELIELILDLRTTVRENKDWAKSDELRDLINQKGYSVKDTKNGVEIRVRC